MEFISTIFFFSNFSGISKAWYPEESVVPFPKGIRGVDINRLSQDIRDVSWLGLVCDRWEDRFRIPLLVSVISTLTPTSRQINDIVNLYICIHAHTHRRENKREGKTWLDEKSPTTDREQIFGFDLERHESGRPCIRQCETLKRSGKFRCFIDTRVIHDPRREYHRWGKK